MKAMTVAIMALQGAFAEHEQMLQRLGVDTFLIRKPEDWLRHKDGLIIPGGESTAMLRIMKDEPVRSAIEGGLPVFGTCAGMILLARGVEGEERERIATMDIVVKRNAYGRQLGSFYTVAPVKHIGQDVPMTFIRAPYIITPQQLAPIIYCVVEFGGISNGAIALLSFVS